MIITEIFYGVKCNRCGDIYDDGEHSFWNDECEAWENASESEWQEIKGRHYCPNCYDEDEETEVITPRPDYPVYLRELIKFLKNSILGYSLEVHETETDFTVIKALHNRSELTVFERAYVTGLTDKYFISMECKKHERYTKWQVEIKIKK